MCIVDCVMWSVSGVKLVVIVGYCNFLENFWISRDL